MTLTLLSIGDTICLLKSRPRCEHYHSPEAAMTMRWEPTMDINKWKRDKQERDSKKLAELAPRLAEAELQLQDERTYQKAGGNDNFVTALALPYLLIKVRWLRFRIERKHNKPSS